MRLVYLVELISVPKGSLQRDLLKIEYYSPYPITG
nr:MAG TPA: hypothetical protein [Caudoviricetes sp.]